MPKPDPPPQSAEAVRPSTLKDGWNQTARDFEEAVDLVDWFAKSHLRLIYRARLASWTQAKLQGLDRPLPFRLNVAALARLYGCDERGLRRRRDELVSARVFLPIDDDQYALNKNYLEWINPGTGKPALSTEQVASVLSAKRPKGTPAPGSTDQGPLDSNASGTGSTDQGEPGLQTRGGLVYRPGGTGSTDQGKTPAPQTPIGERTRETESIETESNTPLPPEAGGVDGGLASQPNAPALTEVERDVYRLAFDAGRDESIAEQIVSQFRQHVRAGHSSVEVHSAYLAASDVPASRRSPRKWGQWVATNLGNRKVRAEVAVKVIQEGAKPRPSPSLPVVASTPESLETARLRHQANLNRAKGPRI